MSPVQLVGQTVEHSSVGAAQSSRRSTLAKWVGYAIQASTTPTLVKPRSSRRTNVDLSKLSVCLQIQISTTRAVAGKLIANRYKNDDRQTRTLRIFQLCSASCLARHLSHRSAGFIYPPFRFSLSGLGRSGAQIRIDFTLHQFASRSLMRKQPNNQTTTLGRLREPKAAEGHSRQSLDSFESEGRG